MHFKELKSKSFNENFISGTNIKPLIHNKNLKNIIYLKIKTIGRISKQN